MATVGANLVENMWEQLAVPTVDNKTALSPDGVGAGLHVVGVVGGGVGGRRWSWSLSMRAMAENDFQLRAVRRNISGV